MKELRDLTNPEKEEENRREEIREKQPGKEVPQEQHEEQPKRSIFQRLGQQEDAEADTRHEYHSKQQERSRYDWGQQYPEVRWQEESIEKTIKENQNIEITGFATEGQDHQTTTRRIPMTDSHVLQGDYKL